MNKTTTANASKKIFPFPNINVIDEKSTPREREKPSGLSASKEALYKKIIEKVLKDRAHLIYKDDLYNYFKKKKPDLSYSTYKEDLISYLKDDMTPDRLEVIDKDLHLRLYTCDLQEIFGLSYIEMKKIIDAEEIPYGTRNMAYRFHGQAKTFCLDSICKVFDVLNDN